MSSAPLVFGQPVAQNNVTAGQFGTRESKKVDAYINLSLPRSDGKDGKLDRGVRLYFSDTDPAMQQLATYLQTPEGIQWFKQNLVVQCNIVTGAGPKAGFAFPTA